MEDIADILDRARELTKEEMEKLIKERREGARAPGPEEVDLLMLMGIKE